VEYRVRRRDGVYRWFKTRGVPIRDGDGPIVKWFGTCTDITDLRHAQEALLQSEERFRSTFENAAVGIAHTDFTGRYLRLNEKFSAIVGYPRAELLQKSFHDITHPDDLTASIESLATLVRGESTVFGLEKRYVREDGCLVWVELFASLQRDAAGQPAYLITVVQDISERKRLDAEFRAAKEAAEAANRAKDEFLANVSHEIRTPMNAILGMTQLALETELTDDQRNCLKTVKSAADNLLSIINDLLDFSKIEAGKLELALADFSLRASVGETLRALAVRAYNKGLDLIYQVQPDVPDALIGDAGRLRQILLNLIENAIKFTDEGEVVVTVENLTSVLASAPASGVMSALRPSKSELPGAPQEPDVYLRFEVRDTGIGIPRDKHQSIFKAFEQEDTSTTRKYGGTGLGLTIAARLVALMGGDITVQSESGRGSTFAFKARFERQPHPPEQPAVHPPPLFHGVPVLVVDDNLTNRRILHEWLRAWKMKPLAVADAAAAMDALQRGAERGQPYRLALIDARMPDVDGLMLAAKIRERSELSATRILLLTSGDRTGDPARSRELGIDGHLLKPIQQDQLLDSICRALRKDRRRTVQDQGEILGSCSDTPLKDGAEGATDAIDSSFERRVSSARLRILVAEDNEFNAQLLEQLLRRRGHQVQVANNGRDALRLAETSKFDLLLLDVHMPELDGFQVVQAVRAREQTAGGHLPVIALTARSRKEDRERCLAAGMDDFLAKPIQAPDLWAAIERIVRNQERARSKDTKSHGPASDSSFILHPSSLDSSLLDARVLLAGCGGDATILERMCQAIHAGLPDRLEAVREALKNGDAPRLREAAHKLCGMIGAVSTVAGRLASDLEDHASRNLLDESRPLVAQLEAMADQILRALQGLSVETLRRRAQPAGLPEPAPGQVRIVPS
jgi:PAS domain S-box-containing protein